MTASREPLVRHIFVTGACGAGKTTLARALSSQLQWPLHRLDDDPEFRQLVEPQIPEAYVSTDPQRYARYQALRRRLVEQAASLPRPHVIEGTHILAAPELTAGHRRILIDTPLHQIVRQYLARSRAKYAEDPLRYAARNAGTPGSGPARERAQRARQIYEGLRQEIEAFRQLPGVEILLRREFARWLHAQSGTRGRSAQG